MPPSAVRRAGSPFTGLGPVFMKELSDHLSSARMMVLMLFVIVFGALPVGFVAAGPAQRRGVRSLTCSCASSPWRPSVSGCPSSSRSTSSFR